MIRQIIYFTTSLSNRYPATGERSSGRNQTEKFLSGYELPVLSSDFCITVPVNFSNPFSLVQVSLFNRLIMSSLSEPFEQSIRKVPSASVAPAKNAGWMDAHYARLRSPYATQDKPSL
jgi:hypothetical protein